MSNMQQVPLDHHNDDKKSTHTSNGNSDIQHDPHYQDLGSEVGSIKQTVGVSKMEAVARVTQGKAGRKYLIGIALAVYACNWVYSMEGSTTYSYAIWATSDFGEHSGGLAALNIATGIISSVCTPFLARFADVFGRGQVYAVGLACYVVGFIIIAASPNLSAYIIGNVLQSIGGATVSLMNAILCADLLPLKWRGMGLGLLSTPYLATVWYTSSIAEALGTDKNWRWGYGMYCIIMPVIMGPAIWVILSLERKARKQGYIEEIQANAQVGDEKAAQMATEQMNAPKAPIKTRAVQIFHEMDTVGLLLLAFGWSLLLLPFSLAGGADHGYANRSLIAMFVVGAVCLMMYAAWEIFYAKYPTAPKRLFRNRTFIMGIIINWIYMVAGYMNLTYVYSYTYIITDFNDRTQNYYNNVLTMGLCSFGVVAGLVYRYTHRYKIWQIAGLAVKIIGMGVFCNVGTNQKGRLIVAQFLVGAGGAMSVVASQIAVQASVPHQDVALVISLLGLWTAIGAGVGSAVSAAHWQANLPEALRRYVPTTIDDATITLWYGNIIAIKEYAIGTPERDGAIQAYQEVIGVLFKGALGISFVPLIAACFQTNYYLGDQQNSITNTDTAGRKVEVPAEDEKPKTTFQRILRLWDR